MNVLRKIAEAIHRLAARPTTTPAVAPYHYTLFKDYIIPKGNQSTFYARGWTNCRRDEELLVFCQVGLRGYVACRILKQHGFTCRNLTGGYNTYQRVWAIRPSTPTVKRQEMRNDSGAGGQNVKTNNQPPKGVSTGKRYIGTNPKAIYPIHWLPGLWIVLESIVALLTVVLILFWLAEAKHTPSRERLF